MTKEKLCVETKEVPVIPEGWEEMEFGTKILKDDLWIFDGPPPRYWSSPFKRHESFIGSTVGEIHQLGRVLIRKKAIIDDLTFKLIKKMYKSMEKK